jgi:hypothetical protein
LPESKDGNEEKKKKKTNSITHLQTHTNWNHENEDVRNNTTKAHCSSSVEPLLSRIYC